MPEMTKEKYIAITVYCLVFIIGCLHYAYAGVLNSNYDKTSVLGTVNFALDSPYLAFLVINGIVTTLSCVLCIMIVLQLDFIMNNQRKFEFTLWFLTYSMLLLNFAMGVMSGVISGYYNNLIKILPVNSTTKTLANISTAQAVLEFLIAFPGLSYIIFTRSGMAKLIVDENTLPPPSTRETEKESVDFRHTDIVQVKQDNAGIKQPIYQ